MVSGLVIGFRKLYYVFMTKTEEQYLVSLRAIAEAYNAVLRGLVCEAAKIIPEDLAADFIYEVIDFERVKAESEKA